MQEYLILLHFTFIVLCGYFAFYKLEIYGNPVSSKSIGVIFFKRFYCFTFRERGREGEIEGEKHQCVAASHAPPTGDLAHNPGMCPDWELNRWPLVYRPVLNPLSYTSQGYRCHFSNSISSLHVSISHFLHCFKLFHHYYICYGAL